MENAGRYSTRDVLYRRGEGLESIPIIQTLMSGNPPENPKGSAKKTLRAKFFMMRGFLYRRSFTHPYLKCLSEQEGEYILRVIHEGEAGAHTRFKDLARKVLSAGFFWQSIEKDAKKLVKQCDHCQKHGRLIHKLAEELRAMFSPCPFDKWGIDIVGKFLTTPGG